MGNCSTICGTFDPAANNQEILKKINTIEEINPNFKATGGPDLKLTLPKNEFSDNDKENLHRKASERKFKEYLDNMEFAGKEGLKEISVNGKQRSRDQVESHATSAANSRKTSIKNKLVKETIGSHERKLIPSITLENGAVYTGEWKNGMRDGKGVQLWPDGSKYEGEWLEDKANGKGKLVHADGDIYDGSWVNDKATGTGTYYHVNGAKYIGELSSRMGAKYRVFPSTLNRRAPR